MTDADLPTAEELRFRTLAAPGLDEDDIFAAVHGLPGSGVLWGESMPSAFPPSDVPWNQSDERERRHRDVLRRWEPLPDEPPGFGR